MISDKIINLFAFVEYLHSNIEKFNQYNQIVNELIKLGMERSKLNHNKNFNDKLKYNKIQKEIKEKYDVLENSIFNPIQSKAKELNIYDKEKIETLWNRNINEIHNLKETFNESDISKIIEHKNKYIEFRNNTKFTYFQNLFFSELDEILKELFKFFFNENVNEFKEFEAKTIYVNNLNDLVKNIKSNPRVTPEQKDNSIKNWTNFYYSNENKTDVNMKNTTQTNYIELTDEYFRQLVYSVSINPQLIIENKPVQKSLIMETEFFFNYISKNDLSYPLIHSLKINEIVYSIDTNKTKLEQVIENLILLYFKHWKTNTYPCKQVVGINNLTIDSYLNTNNTLDNIEMLFIPDEVIKQGIENYNSGLYLISKNETDEHLKDYLKGFDYNEALYNAVKTEHHLYYLKLRLDIWLKLLDKVKLLYSETSTKPIREKKELDNSINDLREKSKRPLEVKYYVLDYILECKLKNETIIGGKRLESIGKNRMNNGKSGNTFYKNYLNLQNITFDTKTLINEFGYDWREKLLSIAKDKELIETYLKKLDL